MTLGRLVGGPMCSLARGAGGRGRERAQLAGLVGNVKLYCLCVCRDGLGDLGIPIEFRNS